MADGGISLQLSRAESLVLFEWLGQAGTPEFKELSRLIK